MVLSDGVGAEHGPRGKRSSSDVEQHVVSLCVYGPPDGEFIATRRRGLAVLSPFIALFKPVTVAATLPALFIQRNTCPYFSTWVVLGTTGQIASYALALVAATLSFLLIYRLTPNAGQHLRDVWPGALVAGGLFVVLGLAFPF